MISIATVMAALSADATYDKTHINTHARTSTAQKGDRTRRRERFSQARSGNGLCFAFLCSLIVAINQTTAQCLVPQTACNGGSNNFKSRKKHSEVQQGGACLLYPSVQIKEGAETAATCQSHGAAVDAPSKAFLLAERRSPVCFAVAVLLVITHLHKDSFIVFYWPHGSISFQRSASGSPYPQ